MNRRTGNLPWGASGRPSLYESPRRSRGVGRKILLAVAAVAVVLFAWFIYGRMCSSADCVEEYCPSSRHIDAPEGYEFVSDIFEYNAQNAADSSNTDLVITVEVTEPVETGESLSFYRFVDETKNWEPIAPRSWTHKARSFSATFTDTPAVMSVMRRNSPGGSVVAYLPHNTALNSDAKGRVSIVHTLDFKPDAAGAITGELSSLKSDGSFEIYPVISANSSTRGEVEFVENILANRESRSNHVQQIVAHLAKPEVNVKGVDIAYLDLPVTARTSFTLFISDLYAQLHAQNKQLTLTLPAPIKAQNRIDEGAYDWAELSKTADLIKIAPYRDQATYRLVMPEVLKYLTERVPPSKLILTVSPYATETGGDTIGVMSIAQAMSIATRVTVRADADAIVTSSNIKVAGTNIDKDEGLTGIRWSPDTATVAFSYKQPQGAGSRTVYLENFFSIGFKLEMLASFKLGGVAVEDASENDFLGDIWSALIPFISSGQPILLRPNEDDLNPRWAVSENGGQVEDTSRGSANWFTPAEAGTYSVSLTLSDGVALFENAVEVNVRAPAR
jgi:spore germination protein YaaH